MYSLVRSNRGILFSLATLGILTITVYLCLRFEELFAYATTPLLGHPYFGWFFAVITAALLVVCAISARELALDFVIYLGSFYVLTDIARLIMQYAGSAAAMGVWSTVYLGGALPLLLTALLCLYGFYNARNIRTKRYALNIAKLGTPLRIAMLSDLHMNAMMTEKSLRRMVNTVNGAKADVVLLCGDIFEERTTQAQYRTVYDALEEMQSTYGTYYVIGNHEYAAQKKGSVDIEELIASLQNVGVTTLQDEYVVVGDCITLAGRLDAASGERAALDTVLEDADASLPIVLLDHRPADIAAAVDCGVDLQLSGHTHAGQLFCVGKLTEWFGHSEMNYGHRKTGGLNTIVSSGVGTWGFPMRVGSRSEVVVVDLT